MRSVIEAENNIIIKRHNERTGDTTLLIANKQSNGHPRSTMPNVLTVKIPIGIEVWSLDSLKSQLSFSIPNLHQLPPLPLPRPVYSPPPRLPFGRSLRREPPHLVQQMGGLLPPLNAWLVYPEAFGFGTKPGLVVSYCEDA